MLHLTTLAGPSRRLALASLGLRAATAGSSGSASASAIHNVRYASTRAPTSNAAPRSPLRRLTPAQWPWFPLNPPRHPGMVEEERVIYSRPPKSSGKLYWAMAILYGSGVVMYLVLPSVDEAKAKGLEGEEGSVLGIPLGQVFTYFAGGAITVFSVIAFFGLVYPSRLITRMSLIRSRPVGAPAADAKEYLRIRHLGHDMMWGKRGMDREVPLQDVRVAVILGRETMRGERTREPWLSLQINGPRAHSRFSFDGYKYRLDFRDTPDLKNAKGEVVLSIARIEDVFGPLQVGNAGPASAAKK